MPRYVLTLFTAVTYGRVSNGIRIALWELICTSGLKKQPRAGFATPGRNRDGVQRDFLDGM
jgi:hypothetical protein